MATKKQIVEAIITLAKCVDSLEYQHIVKHFGKKEFRTREELIKSILNGD